MKLTEWFGPGVKPAMPGVYKRNYKKVSNHVGIAYANFDGKLWGCIGQTPEGALARKNTPSRAQALPWRGLAEKPE